MRSTTHLRRSGRRDEAVPRVIFHRVAQLLQRRRVREGEPALVAAWSRARAACLPSTWVRMMSGCGETTWPEIRSWIIGASPAQTGTGLHLCLLAAARMIRSGRLMLRGGERASGFDGGGLLHQISKRLVGRVSVVINGKRRDRHHDRYVLQRVVGHPLLQRWDKGDGWRRRRSSASRLGPRATPSDPNAPRRPALDDQFVEVACIVGHDARGRTATPLRAA